MLGHWVFGCYRSNKDNYIMGPLNNAYCVVSINYQISDSQRVEDQDLFPASVKSVSNMAGKQSTGGRSFLGNRSSVDAIHKMERRMRRSKRKICKKKLLAELGVKVDKLNHKSKKIPSSSFIFW